MTGKEKYYHHILHILDSINTKELGNISKAAKLISSSILNEKTIFAFGASHAGIITQELFYRAGGLALINPIFPKEVCLDVRPITKTSQMERLLGYGKIILESTAISSGDVIIIHSVSGRNTIAIDMALSAREKGAKVIAITNVSYSKAVESRHPTKKRLLDIADIVIDNCGDYEDSSISIDGINQKVAPTSTISGAFIANSIMIEAIENLIQANYEAPIFHSANVDGGDEFNNKILLKYKDRIHYM